MQCVRRSQRSPTLHRRLLLQCWSTTLASVPWGPLNRHHSGLPDSAVLVSRYVCFKLTRCALRHTIASGPASKCLMRAAKLRKRVASMSSMAAICYRGCVWQQYVVVGAYGMAGCIHRASSDGTNSDGNHLGSWAHDSTARLLSWVHMEPTPMEPTPRQQYVVMGAYGSTARTARGCMWNQLRCGWRVHICYRGCAMAPICCRGCVWQHCQTARGCI
jgi:hypothetical protein